MGEKKCGDFLIQVLVCLDVYACTVETVMGHLIGTFLAEEDGISTHRDIYTPMNSGVMFSDADSMRVLRDIFVAMGSASRSG